MIPLKERVCITALCARISGVNGEDHPRCIGEICVNYEQCLWSIDEATQRLTKDKPKPLQKIRREYE
jgi:hypothetical protein